LASSYTLDISHSVMLSPARIFSSFIETSRVS
jgi:hypothetical protein